MNSSEVDMAGTPETLADWLVRVAEGSASVLTSCVWVSRNEDAVEIVINPWARGGAEHGHIGCASTLFCSDQTELRDGVY